MKNRFTPSGQKAVFTKRNRIAIDALNKIFGTQYRSNPYDLSNEDDLIEALDMAIAEYVDLTHFQIEVGDLVEDTDESLEVFRPYEWFAQDGKAEAPDFNWTRAHEALEIADRYLGKVGSQLEEELRYLFTRVINGESKKAKEHFFGPLSDRPEQELLDILNDVINGDGVNDFYYAMDEKYNGVVNDSVKLFCGVLQNSTLGS